MKRTVIRAALAAGVLVAASAPALATVSADGAPYSTVVDGLRNPRGLDVSANGTLYVAEAGEAGDVCFEGIETEEGGDLCGGLSSRISHIDVRAGTREDFITDLASAGGPLFAIGASGVAVQGNQVYGLMGLNDVAVPPADLCGNTDDCTSFVAAASTQLGHLLRAVPSGRYAWRQDIGKSNFDWTVDNKDTIGAGDASYQPGWAENPDFQPGDANPYGLANAPGGTYMVDGGSNTLTWTPQQGTPQIVAAFPDPDPAAANAYDAVPTCVAPTAHGVVVADLNGRIFLVDGSSITVAPVEPTRVDDAFFAAAGGCASDGHGDVYISDIFTGGVVKFELSSNTLTWVRPPGTLNFPAGVAIGRHGELYVANNSVCPSFPTGPSGDAANPNPCEGVTGSIVRIDP